MNKYKNIKTVVDGITFDSKKEAKEYRILKLSQLAKEFDSFECQRSFKLEINGQLICTYIADFVTFKNGEIFEVLDAKGVKTPAYNLKKKLMKAILGIEIKEL